MYTYPQIQVKVLAVYCDENKVRHAGPGENVRIRLSGIDDEDILSGFVLSSIGKFFKFVLEVTNKGLLVFDVVKKSYFDLQQADVMCVFSVIFSSGSFVVDRLF